MSIEEVHATLIKPNYVDAGLPRLGLGKIVYDYLKG
jgi:hypothetical protein